MNSYGDNKLVIENSAADSSNALIYGEFDNDRLWVNGYLTTDQLGIGTDTALSKLHVEDGSFLVSGEIGTVPVE
jgi:hypothetical protein